MLCRGVAVRGPSAQRSKASGLWTDSPPDYEEICTHLSPSDRYPKSSISLVAPRCAGKISCQNATPCGQSLTPRLLSGHPELYPCLDGLRASQSRRRRSDSVCASNLEGCPRVFSAAPSGRTPKTIHSSRCSPTTHETTGGGPSRCRHSGTMD